MNPPATILAVDDSTASLALFRDTLVPAGYQVRLADSGELALAAVAAAPPDLILLDLQMPGLDGLEVCRRLKAREETRGIPVILLSAYAGVQEWVQGLQLGAVDHLGKPFQAEELLIRVRTHLELSRARAATTEAAALRRLNEQLAAEVVQRQQAEAHLRQSLAEATRMRQALLSTLEDRYRIEESQRESDANLRALLESATQSIILIDLAGTVLALNEIAARRLGRGQGEMLGTSIYDHLPSENVAARRARVAEVATRDEPLRFEDERSGCWLDQTLVPVRDQSGRVVRIAIFAEDITQRKRDSDLTQARARLIDFSTTHTLEELLIATLDEAELLTGSQVGFYHFLQADQQTLTLQAWSTRTTRELCRAEGKGRHYDVSQAGVWVDCVRERRPLIHNDYAALPHRRGLPAGHSPVVRELVVPVFRGAVIVAILGVGNKPSHYVESDIQSVTRLADLAWDIAERKRVEEDLRQRNEELVRFNEAMVGRELRMIELKAEVNALCARQHEAPRYGAELAGEGEPAPSEGSAGNHAARGRESS